MSTRDPYFEHGSEQPSDPFSSSVDESMAATDDFLADLGSGTSTAGDSASAGSAPSSTSGEQSATDAAKQGADDVKQKTQEAADTASSKSDELTSTAQDKAKDLASTAQGKAGELQGKAQDKAGELQGKAQDKADQGIDAAASGLGSVADTIRQQGEQRGGSVGSAATRTADTLEHASQYLRDKDSDQLLNDLESLVREKPVESLLVAAGIGFVLSKLFR